MFICSIVRFSFIQKGERKVKVSILQYMYIQNLKLKVSITYGKGSAEVAKLKDIELLRRTG